MRMGNVASALGPIDLAGCMKRPLAARRDWNVVVTLHEEGFKPAKRILGQVGAISPTDYHDVLVLKVEDPHAFMTWLTGRLAQQPGLMNFISRAVPAAQVFEFHSAQEFEAKAGEAVLRLTSVLAGRSFHVRVHRRGFRRQLSARDEEQRLGAILFEALGAAGTPATVKFDDPDAIVVIETVGARAGVSVFTREDMQRCPFLRFD
jgi:tRNA(Ser,Leu) C12 N-acetylase TAN1